MAVGILSALRPGIRAGDLAAAASPALGPSAAGLLPGVLPLAGAPLTIGSPWQDTSYFASVVMSDLMGAADWPVPVTRAEAMAVPAVARARHIVCTTIARVPIRAYRGDRVIEAPTAPAWIERTDGPVSPWHLKLWTADDLFFYGWSAWWRDNGAGNYPLRMTRIPWGQWTSDGGVIKVDRQDGEGFQPRPADRVVLIPGPHEGLLSFAQGSIRHASDLQRAAGKAAHNPAAHIILKQTGGTPLPKESADPNVMTIDGLIGMWVKARRGENGGVGYLPENLEAKEMGTFDRHLVLDGRNAAAVDIARHASLPADLLDAAGPTSLTYSNSRDNDRRALDYGVGGYMGGFSARLSQGDVTPAGIRVAFDVDEWLKQTVPGQDPQAETPPPVAEPAPANVVPITAAGGDAA